MGNCQKSQTQIVNPTLRNGPVCELKLTNFVWQKAYQGLFDYDSDKMIETVRKIQGNVIVRKQKNELAIIDDKLKPINQQMIKNCLFHIIKKENYFKIFPIYMQSEQFTLQKLLWMIVRTLPNQKYSIKQLDIIKFGKQKVKVKEIVANNSNVSAVIDIHSILVQKQIYDDLKYKIKEGINRKKQMGIQGSGSTGVLKQGVNNQMENQVQSIVTTSESTCRICLQTGLKTNPLISPCKCTGSVKYIHLKCLREWLSKRLNAVKSKNCITLNWQKLNCQMCQTIYRYRIYLDNKKFYTVEIPKPDKPYIVLEVLKKNANDKQSGKLYHFVSLAKQNHVSVGRRKDVDVRISDDISVSRHHASIQYDSDKNEFLLQDNKSKFGTLVLIKKSLLIRPHISGVGFQIGAQVYRFQSFRAVGDQRHIDYNDHDQILNIQEQEDDQVYEQNNDGQDSDQKQEEEQDQDLQPTNLDQSSPQFMRRMTRVQE